MPRLVPGLSFGQVLSPLPGAVAVVPPRFGDLLAWYSPKTAAYSDLDGNNAQTTTGGFIARLTDKTGQGRHVIQANGGARPTLTANKLAAFNGLYDYLAASGTFPSQIVGCLTIIMRLTYYSGNYAGIGLVACAPYNQHDYEFGFVVHQGFGTGTSFDRAYVQGERGGSNPTFASGQPFGTVATLTFVLPTSGNASLRINGAVESTFAVGNGNPIACDVFGFATRLDPSYGSANIGLGETLVYQTNAPLSNADLTKAEAFVGSI